MPYQKGATIPLGSAILRHRGYRIERREAVIQSMDIQPTLDWHSGYRRYPLGLELVIGESLERRL
jgi:hypothetical protein